MKVCKNGGYKILKIWV